MLKNVYSAQDLSGAASSAPLDPKLVGRGQNPTHTLSLQPRFSAREASEHYAPLQCLARPTAACVCVYRGGRRTMLNVT